MSNLDRQLHNDRVFKLRLSGAKIPEHDAEYAGDIEEMDTSTIDEIQKEQVRSLEIMSKGI